MQDNKLYTNVKKKLIDDEFFWNMKVKKQFSCYLLYTRKLNIDTEADHDCIIVWRLLLKIHMRNIIHYMVYSYKYARLLSTD